MLPFQSSHCSQRDSREKSSPGKRKAIPTQEGHRAWTGVISVPLCLPWNHLTRDFSSILIKRDFKSYFLVLTSLQSGMDAGKIHLQRDRERVLSVSCCCCEGQDCQLQPAVRSFIPPSDDKSSCRSKAAVSSEMICYGWSVTAGLSQLCFCATSSNKGEVLHHSEHCPPAEQRHLAVPSTQSKGCVTTVESRHRHIAA